MFSFWLGRSFVVSATYDVVKRDERGRRHMLAGTDGSCGLGCNVEKVVSWAGPAMTRRRVMWLRRSSFYVV